MLSIIVVNLGLFYNMFPEKTVVQQESKGFNKEKVGLDSILIKAL